MKIRYKKMNIDLNFDKYVSLPGVYYSDKIFFLNVVAISKIHNISKDNDSLCIIEDGMELRCNEEDIRRAIDVISHINKSGIVYLDFQKTYDYQFVLMKSGIDVDVELLKISRSMIKKMKNFDKDGAECFIRLSYENTKKDETKNGLRLFSSMLNNFLYEKKINKIKKIDKQFVLLSFNKIHDKVLKFNKAN